MKRQKIEEYPPLVVAVILGLAFLIAGGVHVYRAAAYTGEEPTEIVMEYEAEKSTNEVKNTLYAAETNAVFVDYKERPTEATTSTETTDREREEHSLIGSRDWDAYDSEILLRIAMAEAEGEPTEGKALVMLVVLNRVWTDGFPNSIEEVVMQHSGGSYQFSPVAPGGRYWTKEPNEDCYRALEMVMLDGWDESDGALYFENCNGESWQAKHCEYLYTVGNHSFYR